MAKEKTRICDVIDFEKDIKPFPLVKIYSGVGSGKSYFATKMITGSKEYGIPKQKVLIITSRRSKVEETLKEMGFLVRDKISKNEILRFADLKVDEEMSEETEKYLNKTECILPDFGKFTFATYNKSVVCTNAYISAYLRYLYNPNDLTTHILNKFDAIIIDEVHSLVTDSTYQSATFDVLSLIHEYIKLYNNNLLQKCACKHLILMTGTPQPFETLVNLDFPKNLTNRMDLFDKCENVVPKNIVLIDQQTSKVKIQNLLSSGNKVLYFTNRTLTVSAARKKFALDNSINIGVSFSNEEKRKNLDDEENDKLKDIEESLASNSLIPEHIQFFVTTSRNKEGINIKNNDYKYMFVETHLMYDVVQMAGRVRCGVDTLYIISNAEAFVIENDFIDIVFTKKIMVENMDVANSKNEANKYLTDHVQIQKSYEDRKRNIMCYVGYIEKKFDYVRYNMFNQKFEFFNIKEKATKMTVLQEEKFTEMLSSDNNEFVEHWFPNSDVRRELSAKECAAIYLKDILGLEKQVRLSKDEFNKHVFEVRKLCGLNYTSAKPILHSIDLLFNYKQIRDDCIFYYGEKAPCLRKKSMRKRPK